MFVRLTLPPFLDLDHANGQEYRGYAGEDQFGVRGHGLTSMASKAQSG